MRHRQMHNSCMVLTVCRHRHKNGALEIEDIEDTDLQETIKNYEKWYEKIEDCKDKMDEYNDSVQECRDSISKLYEQQRDLIRQKLDNILSYYSDMDSYLSSITSKIESIISLNDEMGKRSSIYNVIDYCSQTQAVYDHLWNCSYPINELLHSFLDLFTGVKKYVVYY